MSVTSLTPLRRIARQVSLTDLYATVLEIAGIDHESPPDCMSLVPLTRGPKIRDKYDRDVVVSELTRQDKDRRTGELRK